MPLAPGARLGPYEVTSPLGAGAMGEVWRARDTKLGRDVAIKTLPAEFVADPERVGRFEREARVLASLNHPNIAAIYGFEESKDARALVLELVEGPTLADRIAQGPLGVGEALAITRQIAEALQSAHAKGIVHRDLKPANVKLDATGHAKVLDFGIAKASLDSGRGAGSEAATDLQVQTRPGMILGTVRYMSPEQARGGNVDARSDIWSLGVVLYEALSGSAPFAGDTLGHVLVAILEREPRPLAEAAPGIPSGVVRVVTRALARDVAERYQSATEMLADLRELEPGAPGATRPATLPGDAFGATSPPARRAFAWESRRSGLAITASIAVLACGGYLLVRSMRGAAPSAGEQGIDSIAVLPFENLSPDSDAAYLSDGISESLINALARLPALRVTSRGSAFRFRGKDVDGREAGRKLGVRVVLTGRVQRVGGNLVVSVALVDVSHDTQLWGEQYSRRSDDVLATQNDIAREVATRLRVELSGADEEQLARRPTRSAGAYEAYLRGRFYENRLDPVTLHTAVEHYNRATELDPGFALAWTGLARLSLMAGLYFDPPTDTMPKAKQQAARALALQPDLPDAHAVLGVVHLVYDWSWDEARRELVLGSVLMPEAVETFSCSAHLLRSTGRGPEAEPQIRRALGLDPLSVPLNTELGCNSYYGRRYQQAVEEYRAALVLDPGNLIALWGLGRAYGQNGEYAKALTELRRVEAVHGMVPPIITAEVGYALGAGGQVREAQRIAADLERASGRSWVDPYLISEVYLGIGDRDRAMAWLERAYTVRSPFIPSLAGEPKWDRLRSDPQFAAMLARLRLVGSAG